MMYIILPESWACTDNDVYYFTRAVPVQIMMYIILPESWACTDNDVYYFTRELGLYR